MKLSLNQLLYFLFAIVIYSGLLYWDFKTLEPHLIIDDIAKEVIENEKVIKCEVKDGIYEIEMETKKFTVFYQSKIKFKRPESYEVFMTDEDGRVYTIEYDTIIKPLIK